VSYSQKSKSTNGSLHERLSDYKTEIEELRKTENRWSRLLDILDDEFFFFTHGTDRVFTYVSPSITNILGYTQEEYMRSFDDDWTDHPINAEAKKKVLEGIKGIKQPPYEMELFHKDGTKRRVITYEMPIYDSNGKVLAIEGMLRDVTIIRKLEKQEKNYSEHLEEMVQTRTAELENSKKRLLEIIEFMPDALYVVDENKNIIAWNRAIENLTKRKREEILYNKFYEVMGDFYQSSSFLIMEVFKSALFCPDYSSEKFEEHILTEERFIPHRKAPGGKYLILKAAPIVDKDQRFVGAIESIRDITEKKNAQLQIVENERRLFTLMSHLPGMAYRTTKDKSWRYIFVSNGSKVLLDKEPTEIIGLSREQYHELIHPEDRLNRSQKLLQAEKSGNSFQIEYRIKLPEGKDKWVFEKGEVIKHKNQRTIAIEGFVTDFTIYKNMEQKLREENYILKLSLKERYRFDDIIGRSEAMQKVYELILKASTSDDNVFILGETGTGKELVSRAIHHHSKRKDKPFVAINCSAIPEQLIESEFFGYKKGAFTGANTNKKGYLEMANGGTIFLDEISEISIGLQVKLLRAIEGSGFSPVGGHEVIKPDFRIVAASNKDVGQLLKDNKLRQDFLFRIHVISINLPPLRERADDIIQLAEYFIKKLDKAKQARQLSPTEFSILQNHSWPGNVRELQNAIRQYIATNHFSFLTIPQEAQDIHLRKSENNENVATVTTGSFEEAIALFEKNYIENSLRQNDGNKNKTALDLSIPKRTFYRKLKKFGLN
jgi:PAS domain S-box-containing protein